jgi:hypothetical protein
MYPKYLSKDFLWLVSGIDLCLDPRAAARVSQRRHLCIEVGFPDFPGKEQVPVQVLFGLHEFVRREVGIQLGQGVLIHGPPLYRIRWRGQDGWNCVRCKMSELVGALTSHTRGMRFVPSFQFWAYSQDQGMIWIQIIASKLIDWLLELPPDLLGRRIERMLDHMAERRRRLRRVGPRRPRIGRK